VPTSGDYGNKPMMFCEKGKRHLPGAAGWNKPHFGFDFHRRWII
jgi:hypothetical protein